MENVFSVLIEGFTTISKERYSKINLRYQVFGKKLGTAPVVVINHALTGNSQIIGEKGWWNEAVGDGKIIDTQKYSVVCFNVPGNGFFATEHDEIQNYKNWTARDVARIFLQGLEFLSIKEIFTLIGTSVGGGIAWEMIALAPKKFTHFFAIATDWKSTDWVIANSLIQEVLLEKSDKPLYDARMHAMLCYRSPLSFKQKFNRTKHQKLPFYNVETWLFHHGEKLENRFLLSAYKLMNQLVKTIDITAERENFETALSQVETSIHIVGTNSDLYFVPEENRETYQKLLAMGKKVSYDEILSEHGHDAFLIEYEQLNKILKQYLN